MFSRLKIDPMSESTIHNQICGQIKATIEGGCAVAGDQLPSVSTLCRQLNVSSVTVMRCLKDLARDGWITTQRGRGTFVAETVVPTTEVLFPGGQVQRYNSFYEDFLNGVRAGFGEAHRDVFATLPLQERFDARETVEVCRVRRADSIIVWRPSVAVRPELAKVASQMDTVVVGGQIGDGQRAAHIDIDPEPAVRELLAPRLERGARNFMFVGLNWLDAEYCGYRRIRETFASVLAEHGIEPTVCLSENTERSDDAAHRDIGPFMRRLARPGHVVFCQIPALARFVQEISDDLDLLSYTEWGSTAKKQCRMLSLMYEPVEELGRAAAQKVLAIKEGKPGAYDTCWVSPQVVKDGLID